jgi:hypothetical protein
VIIVLKLVALACCRAASAGTGTSIAGGGYVQLSRSLNGGAKWATGACSRFDFSLLRNELCLCPVVQASKARARQALPRALLDGGEPSRAAPPVTQPRTILQSSRALPERPLCVFFCLVWAGACTACPPGRWSKGGASAWCRPCGETFTCPAGELSDRSIPSMRRAGLVASWPLCGCVGDSHPDFWSASFTGTQCIDVPSFPIIGTT